ncbi:MAG: hypothetical protein ABIS29_01835 [Vicinamibacterales bacterium]
MTRMKSGTAIAAVVLLAAATIVLVTPAGDHVAPTLTAQSLNCDMSQYKSASGLTAAIEQGALAVTWNGSNGSELRARYAIDNGQPIVRELAVRKSGGQWAPLGQNLVPEFYVKSGVRRMTTQQGAPLRDLGVDITSELIEKNKWYSFWDAPFVIPGVPEPAPARAGEPARGRGQPGPASQSEPAARRGSVPPGPEGRVYGLPRRPEEIKTANATFTAGSCSVKTDGSRVEVEFPGLSMGIFAGSLRFTSYQGSNLLRMEAIAKTDEQSVAYKYEGGLKGFSTALTPRVTWRDRGGDPQQYEFGGLKNDARVTVKAKNRVLVAGGGRNGSIATFTPPHVFFFTREVDTNLGYTWYRKDGDTQFGFGIRQAEGEENPSYVENFALHNAPPGTMQRMAVYYLVTPDSSEATRQAVMAYTHGDVFKPVPGYKTMVNHFHLRFTERQRASGSLDNTFEDLMVMRSAGINIVGLSDFHGDLRPNDPGAGRYEDQRDYYVAVQKASDKDFLVTNWEEPTAYFGGHYNVMFPKNVYWTKVRNAGQPFTETLPGFGKVYHTGNTTDVQQMLDAEGGYWFHAHPRTKGTTGYPDAIFDKAWVKNDRYLGIAFKPAMGDDLSDPRMCAWRCFDAIDTMNNMYGNTGIRPKYLIADVDTYRKGPEDDIYPGHPINYVKLDRLPGPTDDWSPILKSIRNGDFWVSTGEVLIKNYAVEGTGAKRTVSADLEFTYPLDFVEVVWGDGKKIDKQVIRATETTAHGTKKISIPFDATGKTWVRFAVWDSAGNGAFVQPIWLNATKATN